MNNMNMIFGKRMHEGQMSDYDIAIDEVAEQVLNSLEFDDSPLNDVATYEEVFETASDYVCNDPQFEDFANSAAQDITYRVGQKLGIDFDNMQLNRCQIPLGSR